MSQLCGLIRPFLVIQSSVTLPSSTQINIFLLFKLFIIFDYAEPITFFIKRKIGNAETVDFKVTCMANKVALNFARNPKVEKCIRFKTQNKLLAIISKFHKYMLGIFPYQQDLPMAFISTSKFRLSLRNCMTVLSESDCLFLCSPKYGNIVTSRVLMQVL